MRAVIIQFIPRPKQRKALFEIPFPAGSAFRVNDLTTGRTDVVEGGGNVLSIGEYRDRNYRDQPTSSGRTARESSLANKSGAPPDPRQ